MALTKRYVSQGAEEYLKSSQDAALNALVQNNKKLLPIVGLNDYMGGDGTVIRSATAGHSLEIFKGKFSEGSFFNHLIAADIIEPFKTVQLQLLFSKIPIYSALPFVYSPRCSINEVSGRYSILSEGRETFDDSLVEAVSNVSRSSYNILLEEHEFTRELARVILGTNTHTSFVWKMNLYDLAEFVKSKKVLLSKDDPSMEFIAQVEKIASATAPYSWNALMSSKKRKLKLSSPKDHEIVDPELSSSSWSQKETARIVIPDIEEDLFVSHHFLDHGRFQVVDYMGSDHGIVQAARTSYGQGTTQKSQDKGLIRYLIRNKHTSPLEMALFACEQKNPFFSDPRQVSRHRTAAWGSFMGEVPLGSEFYLPAKEQLRRQSTDNKQGRGDEPYDNITVSQIQDLIKSAYEKQLEVAEVLPKSKARYVKGPGFYTKTWRIFDANNCGRFLALRLDEHAQWEVRQYAGEVWNAFRRHTPITAQAFKDYIWDAVTLSGPEIKALNDSRVLEGNVLDDSALSPLAERERNELKAKLRRLSS